MFIHSSDAITHGNFFTAVSGDRKLAELSLPVLQVVIFHDQCTAIAMRYRTLSLKEHE